ncbi:hypothetical protein [Aeromicrobium panaciterrae]|uniref:hypothetical protein n=1 Tax=Aeromicrobium panaciterrae TaxID=363861 RepID=UPI0031CE616F
MLVIVGAFRLRRMRSAYKEQFEQFGEVELSGQANFFGQASSGKNQVRGIGTLLLTQTELVFLQLVPVREARIPRSAITTTRTTRHFLGKTQGRDLLVVMWNANGIDDAAAFDVADIESWRTKLS